jgi:TRAP-type mannitol/chloroaromatic compound transport system permease large subunit
MRSTLKISSMVFVILLGASVFSLVFRGLGGERIVDDILTQLPGGADGAVLVVMALMFFLGFFLDTFEIIFIVVPITAPVLLGLDVDPVWLGVMFGINLQTSFLTPPFGFSLFYLRGVAPAAITTGHIYRGVVPFVGIQIVALGIVWAYPGIATWLPAVVYGSETVIEEGSPDAFDMPGEDLMLPADEDDGFEPAPPSDAPQTLDEMLEEGDDLVPPPE